MWQRIKELRNKVGLTQHEFAERIGVKRNTVATYEMGRSEPSGAAVALICKEFNVNEHWLRTGEGDMFIPESKTVLEELTSTMGLSAFEVKFLEAYLQLDRPSRDKFCEFITKVADSTHEANDVKEHKKSATDGSEAHKIMFNFDAAAKGAGYLGTIMTDYDKAIRGDSHFDAISEEDDDTFN